MKKDVFAVAGSLAMLCLVLSFLVLLLPALLVCEKVEADNVTVITTNILSLTDNLTLNGSFLSAARDILSADGRVKLSFASNTNIDMHGQNVLLVANESNPPAANDNSTAVRAYSLNPSGATFSPPVTMTLRYETAALTAGTNETGLYIAYWTGSAWQTLPSSVNTTTKEVSASVAHFTPFAIRYLPTQAPANPTPPTTTTTTTTTISTNVLGATGSLILNSGMVTAATSIASTNGTVSLGISANTTVSMGGSQQLSIIQLASPPVPPSNSRVISAYSFSPDGANFNPAATVTIKYSPADVPAGVQESNLYIAQSLGANWLSLPSTVDTGTKTVTALLSHFSTYALIGPVTTAAPEKPAAVPEKPAAVPEKPAAAAAFTASDLTVAPEAARPGDKVTVSLRVANGGGSEDSKPVVLKVNDKNEAQQVVTLAPGKSQIVTFTVSKDTPGTYKIGVEGLSASFQVQPGAASGSGNQQAPWSFPVVAIVVIGGLLLIVLVVVLIMRQRS